MANNNSKNFYILLNFIGIEIFCMWLLIFVSGIDVFNKTKWKGRELRIQPAEDSFLDK